MTAYAKDKTTKENIEVPTEEEYLEHEISVSGSALGKRILIGNNARNGLITFLKDVTTEHLVNAGSIQDVKITSIDRPTITEWEPEKALVFVTKTSGTADCHIDHAKIAWDASTNKYWVQVTLKNLTNSNVDYDGTTNVMIVDWN